MKRLKYLLAILAVALIAAPALAKGGHSGGHSHASGGHASHSASHSSHHSNGQSSHHSTPKSARKSTTNPSAPHAAHQGAVKVAHHPTPNAADPPKPTVAGNSTSPLAKHRGHRPYQSKASKLTSNPAPSTSAPSNPANPTSSQAPRTINLVSIRGNAARNNAGARRGYYSQHGPRYGSRRRISTGAPSFVKGPDQVIPLNSGPQTVAPWATRISAGGSNASLANLVFQVTGDTRPGLFRTVPSVSPSGTLSYEPAPGQTGTATITLVLRNNSPVQGGRNTSRPRSFNITVVAG